MAIELNGISLPLDGGDEALREAAAARLCVRGADIARLRVKRQSLDSRRKDIRFVYTVHVALHDKKRQKALERKFGAAQEYAPPEIAYGGEPCGQPVVVGAGPCGLFAALTLAQHGYRPLLLERGRDIAARERDVEALCACGELNPESNVCFGAGGAGAFSAGKLTTRIKDARAEAVLETLVSCGAPREILTLAKPHTGTEHIRAAVSGMIERIRALGGQVEFESALCGLAVTDGALSGIWYRSGGARRRVETRAAVIAIGHSARDTYELLTGSGVALAPKAFAVGLRIEHPRELIDRAQYGQAFGHPRLGAAEYTLKSKHGGRGVYTFCMCPGGEVICSATEPGGLAVNGMSYYARGGENSNSAVVVSVTTEDFCAGAAGRRGFCPAVGARGVPGGFYRARADAGRLLCGLCRSNVWRRAPHVPPRHGACRFARLPAGFCGGGHRLRAARLRKQAKGLRYAGGRADRSRDAHVVSGAHPARGGLSGGGYRGAVPRRRRRGLCGRHRIRRGGRNALRRGADAPFRTAVMNIKLQQTAAVPFRLQR
jgi:uncharacterized FAD-dependent dehydrogenase